MPACTGRPGSGRCSSGPCPIRAGDATTRNTGGRSPIRTALRARPTRRCATRAKLGPCPDASGAWRMVPCAVDVYGRARERHLPVVPLVMASPSPRLEDLGLGPLFWTLRDAALVVDADSGRILLWNPAAAALFGCPAEDAVGLPLATFVPARADDHHPLSLAACRRDGAPLLIELTLTPIATEATAARPLLAIVRDVAARAPVDSSPDAQAPAHPLLEGSPAAIAVHRDGRLLYANPAAARLVGAVSPADLVGRAMAEIIRPSHPRAARRRAPPAAGQVADVREERLVRFDGQVLDVEVAALPTRFAGAPA